MLNLSHKITELISQIYDAATDRAAWSDSLRLLGEMLGSRVSLSNFDPDGNWGDIPYVYGIDPAWVASYRAHYYKKNDLVRRAFRTGRPGEVLIGSQIVPDEELLSSEIYNEWFKPQDLFHVAGGIVFTDAHSCSILGVHRSRKNAPFAAEDLRLLRSVLPHFKRATEIQIRLRRNDVLSNAVDQMAFGVIVIGADYIVLHANRCAQEILSTADGLWLRSGHIKARDTKEDHQLRSLIDSARSLGKEQTQVGGTMAISRSSYKRPYAVTLSRGSGQRSATAVLFVTDLERHGTRANFEAVQYFGLTKAESKIAVALMQGSSPKLIAEKHGIALATVRTHIRHLLAKTQVDRQADLMRILLAIPNSGDDHPSKSS